MCTFILVASTLHLCYKYIIIFYGLGDTIQDPKKDLIVASVRDLMQFYQIHCDPLCFPRTNPNFFLQARQIAKDLFQIL